MFSREEIIRAADRLCSTIENAERRYKDLQEQRDELLAACKAVVRVGSNRGVGWLEYDLCVSAIQKAESSDGNSLAKGGEQ